MLQAPYNSIIVKVDTKYIKSISSIMRMSAIQNNSSVNPADTVNIIGEIISLPKKISDTPEYKGYSTKDIKVGDKAIFSHQVIFNFIEQGANDDPIYRNRFFYHGEEYFMCNIQFLYGVIRNNEVIMVNGYTMVFDFQEPKIILNTNMKKKISVIVSELMHIGSPKEGQPELPEISTNDNIYFPSTKAIRYKLGEKSFCILNQAHILGKAVVTG